MEYEGMVWLQLLFGCLLTRGAAAAGGGAERGDGGVLELTRDVSARLPPPYDVRAVSAKYPVQYYNSMNTVLKQVGGRQWRQNKSFLFEYSNPSTCE